MNPLFPELMPAPGDDVAYTPQRVADACVNALRLSPAYTAWEPYVGGGSFQRALWDRGIEVLSTDIDPACPGLRNQDHPLNSGSFVHDVSKGLPFGFHKPAWVISNPPFSCLDEHLPKLFEAAEIGVALLIIGQWLAPQIRDYIWDGYRPDELFWVRERIAFEGPARDGKSTDAREYAFVVWRRTRSSQPWQGRGLMRRLSWATSTLW